jgi:hypothetical protein
MIKLLMEENIKMFMLSLMKLTPKLLTGKDIWLKMLVLIILNLMPWEIYKMVKLLQPVFLKTESIDY